MLSVLLITAITLFLGGAFARTCQARTAIRRALNDAGCEVVRLTYRWFSFGSGLGLPGHGQVTYRFAARDSNGQQRSGWARWGRVWVLDPDRLELRWDDEASSTSWD